MQDSVQTAQSAVSSPRVSVAMITYNHAPYVAQAIDSVLCQETGFAVELLVGEDCSTDGTRAIVEAYARKFPGRVRPMLHEHNVGMQANAMAVLNACTGEYIAFLEGDDYWDSPHKLQKQVDLLDAHKDAAFCFHNTRIVVVGEPGEDTLSHPEPPDEVTIESIFPRWSIMTSSILLRRDLLLPLPAWALEVTQMDKMMQMMLASRGRVMYVDEVMSVYRRHPGGATRLFSDPLFYLEDSIRLYTHFDAWSEGKYRAQIQALLAGWHFGAALQLRATGRYREAWRALIEHLCHTKPLTAFAVVNALRKLLLPMSWNASLSDSMVSARLKRLGRKGTKSPTGWR